MRPATLAEAVERVRSGAAFGVALDEFLDAFYLDHPDKDSQQHRIDEAPAVLDDAFQDAWVAAVGEHLARRWGLQVPAWTSRPEGYALTELIFVPPSAALHERLDRREPAGIPVAVDLHVRRAAAAR